MGSRKSTKTLLRIRFNVIDNAVWLWILIQNRFKQSHTIKIKSGPKTGQL